MEDSQSIRSEPNTKLHRLYQYSKSLLYLSPPLPTSPVGFFWSGEMAFGELGVDKTPAGAELVGHSALGLILVSWHLAFWQFY